MLSKKLRLEQNVQVAAEPACPQVPESPVLPHLDADWHISNDDKDEYSAV